jgi:PKD repeat protein
MRHTLLTSLIFIISLGAINAQRIFDAHPVELHPEALQHQFSRYELVQLDVAAIHDFVSAQNQDIHFQLHAGPAINWDLQIVPHDIRSANFQTVVQSAEGRAVLPLSTNTTYRGYSNNDPSQKVRLTIDQDFFYGLVENSEQTFFIEPAWTFDASLGHEMYVIYAEEDVLDLGHTCGTTHEHHHQEQPPTAPEAARMMMNCYQLPIALAADFSIFSVYGSITNTQNFMVGVLNNVQTNYDDEFNDQIIFEVAGFFISNCSSCDPWTSSTNAGTLLDDFTNWGNSGGFGFSYSLASLWTNRNLNGSTVGVAWLGGLCTSARYNLLQRFTTNANTLRQLQAHEFGHNFNAFHDASGSPFIMAPAVNGSSTWSTTSLNTMNSFIAQKANQPGCFFSCGPALPPEANIIAPVTHVCPGSVVPFIDASTNNPTSWDWDFPGGAPSASSLQNPLVQYPNEGIYTVSLTVENSIGVDVAVLNTDIQVDANGTKYLLYETFENGLGFWSTQNPDGSVTWNTAQVGGTQYGTRAAFMDNYDYNASGQVDGLISPTLDFSGQSGLTFQMDYAYRRYNNSNSDQMRILISTNGGNTYPDELFFGQETGGGNFATSFDLTSNFVPSAQTDWCYAGAFGPGCITLDLSAYAGENNVKIKIENINDYGNNLYVDNIRITADCQPTLPPIASFFSDVTSGCAPLAVQFEDTSFGTVDNWEWSFPGGTPSTSFDQFPTVTYNLPGVYDVTLTAYNSAGSDNITLPGYITVEGPPTPDFIYDVQDFTVDFTDLSINANSINWNFGDGNFSNEISPSYTYAEEGEYIVTLVANNDCGTDSIQQTITIVDPLMAAFKADTTHGCPGLIVNYMDTTMANVVDWAWFFEGGIPDTSSLQNPTVTYDTSGLFTTTLIVTNDVGNIDTLEKVNYIQIDTLPEAGFTFQYTLGADTVAFTNTSAHASSYYWYFGDGDSSIVENPTHTYDMDSTYMVTLIAESNCGTDTTSQMITIITLPNASFTLDPTNNCAPFSVSPVNTSSSNVDSLIWLAPGAMPDTSYAEAPSFTYPDEGLYTLTLIVFNGAGSDTSTVDITVNDIPQANFTFNYTPGQLSVDFINQSINADNFAWSFGDGNTAMAENPSHTYLEEGIYDVSLIASNECGADTSSMQVEIITLPTADFTIDNDNGCAPFTVSPIDNSASSIDSWYWIADGAMPDTSSSQSPTFVYNDQGTYTITLIVTNEAGSDTTALQVNVNDVPQAAFAYDNTIGETITNFTNQSAHADAYQWFFGDGASSNATNPSHDYSGDGIYDVLLIATNNCGNDTSSMTVEITTLPTAGFSIDNAQDCAPLIVSPNDQSSGNTDAWAWSAPGASPATSTDSSPDFAYDMAGDYTITLITTNEAGSDTATVAFTLGTAPQADFDIDYTIGQTSLSLTNQSVDADSFEWLFGDGNASNEQNPTHSFQTDGIYTIQLIAFNDCGSDTSSADIEIITLPVADFSLDNADGCVPLVISPNDQSSDNTDAWAWSAPGASPATSTDSSPDFAYDMAGDYTITLITTNEAGSDTATVAFTLGTAPQADFDIDYTIGQTSLSLTNQSVDADSFEWLFGDGNASNEQNPTHSFQTDGIYTIQLIAFNDCGSDTSSADIEIITLPVADFSLDNADGCVPLIISPNDQSSGNTDAWAWSAPGASPATSTDSSPDFAYDMAGDYTITLITTNEAGSDTATVAFTLGTAPQADFDIDYTIGQTSLSLTNQSVDADSFEWLFGDGNASNEQNPTHSFQTDGIYTIQLIAFNDCGSDTSSADIEIITLPVADFSLDNTDGCVPLIISPNDQSSDNTDAWAWSAPGASPATSTDSSPDFAYDMAGDYTITLITTNEAGSDTATVAFTLGTAPQADFDIDYTIGQTSLSLTNQSVDADSFEWLFGDGNSSNEQNPTHSFQTDGIYTIQLIAFNDCGSDTSSADIEIITLPVADFSLDNAIACEPYTASPTDQSSDNTDTWSWFAPGATPESSTDTAPAFTYSAAGDYVITLITSNEAGSDTASLTLVVGQEPVADFSYDYTLGETLVDFTDLSMNADDISWLINGDVVTNESTTSYDFNEDGIYTTYLIASNACGNDTMAMDIEIITLPTADFSLDNTTGCIPFTVDPVNSSSANTDNWLWLADGATPATSNSPNPSFTYENEGDYTLILITSNEAGNDTTELGITLGDIPEALFETQQNGLAVSLTNNSIDADSYLWDFGDENTSSAPNPTHTYDSLGTFIISLSATNECGTAVVYDTITVSLDLPIASFDAENNMGCAPLEVSFFNTSQHATSFMWTFEGGTPATSTEENPLITYDTPGTYSVTLLASNLAGSGAITQMDIVVVEPAPGSNFDYTSNGTTFDFTNTSVDADQYLWLFGDGETSTLANPTHTYLSGGSATVYLIAINDCGADTSMQLVMYQGEAPVPVIGVTDTFGCIPLSVDFFGSSTGGEATTYDWTFEGGEPSTSNEQNPTVTYSTVGQYTVSLTTSNGFGSNNIQLDNFITVLEAPTLTDIELESGDDQIFTSDAVGDILSYEWDFGNGETSTMAEPTWLEYYTESGIYTVSLTVSNECGSVTVSEDFEIVVGSVINENWVEQLSIYPNPNTGQFTIDLLGEAGPVISGRLINVVGQQVFDIQDSFHTGRWNYTFDLPQLSAGVYILEVATQEQKAYRRVVIE